MNQQRAQAVATCQGKVTFASRGQAARSAENLARKNRGRARAYHCAVCSRWHVTSQMDGNLPAFGAPGRRRRRAQERAGYR